jgi:hypothetical protein
MAKNWKDWLSSKGFVSPFHYIKKDNEKREPYGMKPPEEVKGLMSPLYYMRNEFPPSIKCMKCRSEAKFESIEKENQPIYKCTKCGALNTVGYQANQLGAAGDLLGDFYKTGKVIKVENMNFNEWLKNRQQFEDAEFVGKKLIKAGMDPLANTPEILDALQIMNITDDPEKPWYGCSPELFAARIKQILRGNVSIKDFNVADRGMNIRIRQTA